MPCVGYQNKSKNISLTSINIQKHATTGFVKWCKICFFCSLGPIPLQHLSVSCLSKLAFFLTVNFCNGKHMAVRFVDQITTDPLFSCNPAGHKSDTRIHNLKCIFLEWNVWHMVLLQILNEISLCLQNYMAKKIWGKHSNKRSVVSRISNLKGCDIRI